MRTDAKFHTHQVREALPEFFQEDYPNLIEFLDQYYKGSSSIHQKVQSLLGVRDVTDTDLESLDDILAEIGDGIEIKSFAEEADPRLMTKLIAQLFRSKGTQLSAEQFFKGIYGESVEITYPKKDIFIVGESKIGPQCMKYITDDRRYQVFSVLLKTGLSMSDYKDFYKKFVHPAGFYLAADVETQSISDMGIVSGEPIDPLETPNYPVSVHTSSIDLNIEPKYNLLVMYENSPVDLSQSGLAGIYFGGTQVNRVFLGDQEIGISDLGVVVSSLETLSRYQDLTIEDLIEQYGTIENLVSPVYSKMDSGKVVLSSTSETIDAEEYL